MRKSFAAVAMTVLFTMPAPVASAHDYALGTLHISHPWSRATPPNSNVGAGFMSIRNGGTDDDALLSASSPAADRVELHSVDMVDGVMKMRPVKDGLPLAASAEVTLEPGGYHFMLIGIEEPFREGTKVPLELTFEKAGAIEVELAVGPLGGAASSQDHGGH